MGSRVMCRVLDVRPRPDATMGMQNTANPESAMHPNPIQAIASYDNNQTDTLEKTELGGDQYSKRSSYGHFKRGKGVGERRHCVGLYGSSSTGGRKLIRHQRKMHRTASCGNGSAASHPSARVPSTRAWCCREAEEALLTPSLSPSPTTM